MVLDKEKILKAGKITKEVRDYAHTIVKKDVPLLEIAEKIESKIVELGGKPAFPVNLSINEIAAHYTPSHDDRTLAHGLLKVDFGVNVDGWIADNAFSRDLDNSEENKRLIQASGAALFNASKIVGLNISTSKIGAVSGAIIESFGFSPVVNLSGHSMEKYNLHAGITIPNVDDKKDIKLTEGLYAIEPFATNGSGRVHDGKPSGIYSLTNEKTPRSPIAREVLNFVEKEHSKLPFCSRWIVNELGTKALFGLRELEANGNLHQYAQLVEKQGAKVSQTEHTILIDKDGKVIVTSE